MEKMEELIGWHLSVALGHFIYEAKITPFGKYGQLKLAVCFGCHWRYWKCILVKEKFEILSEKITLLIEK